MEFLREAPHIGAGLTFAVALSANSLNHTQFSQTIPAGIGTIAVGLRASLCPTRTMIPTTIGFASLALPISALNNYNFMPKVLLDVQKTIFSTIAFVGKVAISITPSALLASKYPVFIRNEALRFGTVSLPAFIFYGLTIGQRD